MQVAFEVGNLSSGESISISLGEDTTGDEWQANSITTFHISCSDNGTGETYTFSSVNVASAISSMGVIFTATTVDSGATTVACFIGNSGANNPDNPISADGFSVTVITTEDAGVGIVYVGNSNEENKNTNEEAIENTNTEDTSTNEAVNENTNIASVDTDGDGLSDDDEALYGADLLNPDSDGNGYMDGSEVRDGFNSNGDGSLEE